MLGLLTPDATWQPMFAELLEHSVYRGPEAIVNCLLEEVPDVLEGFALELLELRDLGGDSVFAAIRLRGRLARADAEVEQVFGQIVRIRDGKAFEFRAYPSKADALEAAGLSE
jgi:ketosteroid isomerase-like protein